MRMPKGCLMLMSSTPGGTFIRFLGICLYVRTFIRVLAYSSTRMFLCIYLPTYESITSMGYYQSEELSLRDVLSLRTLVGGWGWLGVFHRRRRHWAQGPNIRLKFIKIWVNY